MIKIVICSNNSQLNSKLKNYLQKHINSINDNKKYTIITFLSFNEVRNYWLFNKDIDLLFIALDICELSLIKDIQKEQEIEVILLVTSLAELINIYYILRPCSFLISPISYKFLIREFEYAKKILLSQLSRDYIVEKNDSGIYKIYIENIIYIETYNRNTLIHINDKCILSYKTLTSFEKNLGDSFFRIHESYLVNMNAVIEITNLTVTLYTKDQLSLSKYRRPKFLTAYKKFTEQ